MGSCWARIERLPQAYKTWCWAIVETSATDLTTLQLQFMHGNTNTTIQIQRVLAVTASSFIRFTGTGARDYCVLDLLLMNYRIHVISAAIQPPTLISTARVLAYPCVLDLLCTTGARISMRPRLLY
jgi:hypothetical protein